EILNNPCSSAVLGVDSINALFRLGGNREGVAAQRAALAVLGTARDVDEAAWNRLRVVEPPNAIVFRLSRLPADIGSTWADADAIAAACAGTLVHASPSRGVARCIIPSG